jgi:hypothetical protein
MTNHFYTCPPTDDLVFQLYGRPVHPEFFEILARRRIARPDYTLDLWITRTGHVMTWKNRQIVLTEVTSAERQLPEWGQLLEHQLRGQRCDMLGGVPGLNYQVSFQVERLSPEQFLTVHYEILADGGKAGLLHAFAGSPRLALSPVATIQIEGRAGGLSLATYHTFPDECAVVKTQSLIERC